MQRILESSGFTDFLMGMIFSPLRSFSVQGIYLKLEEVKFKD